MRTDIYFNEEAKQKLFDGMEKVYKAVSVTLGSRGFNAALTRWGQPLITNDGVSIARKIFLVDEAEAMGADFIKEVAERTNEEAGDGTTTATILTYHLIVAGKTMLQNNAQITAMQLRRELGEALELALKKLSERAIKVEGRKELQKIANISSEDKAIADLVVEAVEEAGSNGRVVVEQSQKPFIEKEKIKGMEIEGGFISPYFITSVEKEQAIVNSPFVLITNRTFTVQNDILPLMNALKAEGHNDLVVVCKDAQAEALTCMIANKVKGVFNVVAVRAPHTTDALEDLAAFCGKDGALTDEKYAKKLYMTDLIKVDKVIAYKDKTLFIKENRVDTEQSVYNARFDSLRSLVDDADTGEKEKKTAEDRLARFTSSVVLIKAGSPSRTEMDYLYLKIEDAVNAVKAAIKEGYVAGAGITLKTIGQETLDELKTPGADVLKTACAIPVEILVKTAGVKYDPSKITATDGFDTESGKYVKDLIGKGIIDPVLVEKKALTNAVHLASMFLTVETLIVDRLERPQGQPQA